MKMKTKKPKEQTKDPKPPGHWSLKRRAAVQPKKESALPLPPEEGVEDSKWRKGQRSPGSSTSCRIPTPTLASLATSAHKRKTTGEAERQREEREVTISIHQLQN